MIRSTTALFVAALLAACGTDATPEPVDSGGTDSSSDISSDTPPAPDAPEPDAEDTREEDASDPDVLVDAESDAPEPDTLEPDTGEPNSPEPDSGEPDTPGSDTSEPDTGEPDTPEPDIGEPDTPEPDTGDHRMCTSDDSGFPDYRSGCREAADCTQAFHQLDCCGTNAAIGVLASTHDEFLDAEDVCRGEYDRCRCAARPTQTDDGVLVSELSDFEVECDAGFCVSVGARDPSDVICSDRVPTTFPDFDNSCVEYDDCVAVPHQYDCCGNMHMVGVNRDYLETFNASELNCRAEFPACGCPVGPFSTDSGTSAFSEEIVEAMCRDGVCYTFVPL